MNSINSSFFFLLTTCFFTFSLTCHGEPLLEKEHIEKIEHISTKKGLIAFWVFTHTEDDIWQSYYDPAAVSRSLPIYLKRIGDPKNYNLINWPYTSQPEDLIFDTSGPFGYAPRFNKGYIYGLIPREYFDDTALNIHGNKPFSLTAWVKFIGKRHLVAGIWDEGGWYKYAGRRQFALFAGLLQEKGVIAHVSATGAASFPQSTISGSQYARIRAIDGQAFENDQWVFMAMTFDPVKKELRAYSDGKMTGLVKTDLVEQDVYQYDEAQSANPVTFDLPIYSPTAFTLKYNGYDSTSGVSEHILQVDFNANLTAYKQIRTNEEEITQPYRILFNINREGKYYWEEPFIIPTLGEHTLQLPTDFKIKLADAIYTSLEQLINGNWQQLAAV